MVTLNIDQPGGIGPLKPPDTPRAAPPAESPPVRPVAPTPADRAEVTPELQDASRLKEAAQLVLRELPDVRPDRVELARRRLAEGYYDRPEVRQAVAAAILADPELPAPSALTPQRLAEIRRRLTERFYDQPEVVERIIHGLARDAGLEP